MSSNARSDNKQRVSLPIHTASINHTTWIGHSIHNYTTWLKHFIPNHTTRKKHPIQDHTT